VSGSLLHKVITTKKAKKKAPASHVVSIKNNTGVATLPFICKLKLIVSYFYQSCILQIELREACKSYVEMLKCSTTELHSTLGNIQVTELSKDLLELSLTEMDKEV
jgi:hypothetical protein